MRYSSATLGRPIPYVVASTQGKSREESIHFFANLNGQTKAFGDNGASAIAEEAKLLQESGENLAKKLNVYSTQVTSELVVYNAGSADIAAGITPKLEILANPVTGNMHLKEIVVVDRETGQLFTYRNGSQSELFGAVMSPKNSGNALVFDLPGFTSDKTPSSAVGGKSSADGNPLAGVI